jgi:hypothetical protein
MSYGPLTYNNRVSVRPETKNFLPAACFGFSFHETFSGSFFNKPPSRERASKLYFDVILASERKTLCLLLLATATYTNTHTTLLNSIQLATQVADAVVVFPKKTK